MNFISKKKESVTSDLASNCNEIPMVTYKPLPPILDISTYNKPSLDLNEQAPITRGISNDSELIFDPLSNLQNAFLDQLDNKDTRSVNSLEVNVSESNCSHSSVECITNIIKSSFTVSSPYEVEFTFLTFLFDCFTEIKYIYLLIIIIFLFKLIILIKSLFKYINSIITSYFKLVVLSVLPVLQIENKFDSFLNLGSSKASNSKGTTNLKDMDNSFLNLDNPETSSVSSSLVSIYGYNILNNSTEKLTFITKIKE